MDAIEFSEIKCLDKGDVVEFGEPQVPILEQLKQFLEQHQNIMLVSTALSEFVVTEKFLFFIPVRFLRRKMIVIYRKAGLN